MKRAKPATVATGHTVAIASPIPGVPFLGVRSAAGRLESIDYLSRRPPTIDPAGLIDMQALILLQAYLADGHAAIPHLDPLSGTPYQRRVWDLLQRIPPGEVRTYGELARQLGSSARAVAAACRANPLAILIPCHRVVSATGLGGYMGATAGPELEIKRWLLHHEGHV